jgi:phytoene dehydrogenase-like protein
MQDGGHWPYIVIGGGLAGLAAAQQLTATYGAQNMLVLEARDRIGGRVKTVRIGNTNATIDVGASWIHGTETSPLYPIAQRLGLDVGAIDVQLNE